MTGKNKNKILGALVAVLAVICGVYFGVSKYMHSSAQKAEADAAAASEAGRIWVTQMDTVQQVSFDNGVAELSFTKKEDTWYYDGDEYFPVSQDALDALASAAGSMEATRAIEEGDALADYGLEKPAVQVTVTDTEERRVVLALGNPVNSEYYLKTADSGTVYTVSADLMNAVSEKTLYDFVVVESLPAVSAEKIQTMEVDTDGKAYRIERNETEDSDDAEPEETKGSGETEVADETKTSESEDETEQTETPDEEEASDTAASDEETRTWTLFIDNQAQDGDHDNLGRNLAQTLSGMGIAGCVDYNAGENELSGYGLDDPPMRIHYTFEGDDGMQSVTIYVGYMTEDESAYYVMVNDSSAVNTISAETVNGIKGYMAE